MGDLSRNLSLKEFECSCGCGFCSVDDLLIQILQTTVDYFQEKYPLLQIRIKINSGCRCAVHNRNEGGKEEMISARGLPIFRSGSYHLYGLAADFYLYDKITMIHIPDDEVADYLELTYPEKFGIGRYKNRTHLDVRELASRWDKR